MRVWAVIIKPTDSAIGQYIDTIWASINSAHGRVNLLTQSMAAAAFRAKVWAVELAIEDTALVNKSAALPDLPAEATGVDE